MPKKQQSSKSVGQMIDEVFELDLQIDELESQLREIKKSREEAEMKLLTRLRQDEIESARGTRAQGSIKTVTYPSIKDRLKFQKFVLKHKAFDLYQNRIGSKAYFDRKEAGIIVPGVAEFEKTYVSITKRR